MSQGIKNEYLDIIRGNENDKTLERISSGKNSGGDGGMGGNEKSTIYDLLKAVNNKKDDGSEHGTIEVVPVPAFVIKTYDENKQKTFVNICGCDQISAPGNWENGNIPSEVTKALNSPSTQNHEFLRLLNYF